MATKRKGKKVNKAAKSRKKMPRKMLGNKRKSLKNKTSRRKRMNRKAGMDEFLRGGGGALGTLLYGEDSQERENRLTDRVFRNTVDRLELLRREQEARRAEEARLAEEARRAEAKATTDHHERLTGKNQ